MKNPQTSIKEFSTIYFFLDLMMKEYILDTVISVFVGFLYFSILIFEEAYRYHWHYPKTINIADIDKRFTHYCFMLNNSRHCLSFSELSYCRQFAYSIFYHMNTTV